MWHIRFAVLENHRRARRQAWTLAGRHGARVSLDGPRLRATRRDYETSARHHRSLRTAVARRRREDVAVPIDDAEIRGVEPVGHRRFRRRVEAVPGHGGAVPAAGDAGRWHSRVGLVEMDQVAALGRVFLGQERLHRHVDEFRIAVVALAVSERELQRLGQKVDVGRRVEPERLQVIARQERQDLGEHRSLTPRTARVDVVLVKADAHRFLDRRADRRPDRRR